MERFVLNNGKVVELNIASIDNGLALFRAIINECKKAELEFKGEDNFAELLSKNIPAILNIIGSEDVLNCIIDCCDKVVYNKQKFSKELFDDVKNREDFFPLMQLIAVENLRPFFPQLHIVFNAILSLIVKD